ncbi:MAG: DUF188 domain-containing protein, partial [Candidatus Desulfacyla sp.]
PQLGELRESGEVTGGPPPFNKRDRSRFLQSLDSAVNEIRGKMVGMRSGLDTGQS